MSKGNLDFLEVFHELSQTNSVKEKEAILRKYKGGPLDPSLPILLAMNLSTYAMFYIKDIPEYVVNPVGKQGKENYEAFVKLTADLASKRITGNEAKEAVRQFFMESHAEEAGLYELILSKGSIGVGTSTVNKVWPKLIPEFDLMLAPNKLPNVTQLKYPAQVQPKLDGYRCVYMDRLLWSRSGKPFGNKGLLAYFDRLESVGDYVLDGELYIHGISFQNLTKVLNAENAPIPAGLKYVVYDCVPNKDWKHQGCKLPYSSRLTLLRSILNDKVADYSKIIDISSDVVADASELIKLYKDYIKQGYEGVMIKDSNGLYQWKRVSLRSAEMVKLKPFKTIDVKIEGIYEGEGEFTGKAGGVNITHASNAVCVGSGFDIATRESLFKDPSKYIGKTIEVQYFEETEEGSLRFPTFKRFRPEKD